MLLLGGMGSAFYIAGLANVPFRVRVSLLTIPPSFILALLLHARWAIHQDWGLFAIGASIALNAVVGFEYTSSGQLSAANRSAFFRRFLSIVGCSAVIAGIYAFIVLRSGQTITGQQETSQAATVSPLPTPKPVTPADSIQLAIDSVQAITR